MDELGAIFASGPPSLVNSAFTEKQADTLRRRQDDLIDEMQNVADRWCARRHKSVQAAFELGVTSLQNSGPTGMAEAWTRWFKGAFERLSEDATDQMQFAATVAKCCGNGAFTTGIDLGSAHAKPNESSSRTKA